MTTPEHCMATALWALHCWVFDRFNITPRLALLSPVYGCGKTTLLILLEALTPNSERIDNVTAASIYRSLDSAQPPTLLLDEGDNLGLLNDRNLRAVMNSGHRRGRRIRRCCCSATFATCSKRRVLIGLAAQRCSKGYTPSKVACGTVAPTTTSNRTS
jgi:hypothetical protein